MKSKKIEVIKRNIGIKYLQKKLYKLNKEFLASNEKVAYLYEDVDGKHHASFNENTTFYAASTIKILVCLYIYEQAADNKLDLNKELELTIDDMKPDTFIVKEDELPISKSIRELVKYTLIESDNCTYIKLVDYVGFEKLKEYGKSLGATTTLEGKDKFGIINAKDALLYLKRLYKFINEHEELGSELKEYMINSTWEIVKPISIDNRPFIKKFGEHDIVYHEIGIVEAKEPYYLIILTGKGKLKNRNQFIDKTAKQIHKLHTKINN